MSLNTAEERPSLYAQYEGTTHWHQLDKALEELSRNRDLEEKTRHDYIVGFLCEALASRDGVMGDGSVDEPEMIQVRATIARAQTMMREADPGGGSMADEMISERRREATGEYGSSGFFGLACLRTRPGRRSVWVARSTLSDRIRVRCP